MITKFNKDFNQIRKIITKYWNIVQCDPILKVQLSQDPQVIIRKAKNIKNIIAPSRLKKRMGDRHLPGFTFLPLGCYRCNKTRCKTCSHLLHEKEGFIDVNNKEHSISDFINCSTQYITYALFCPCNKICRMYN